MCQIGTQTQKSSIMKSKFLLKSFLFCLPLMVACSSDETTTEQMGRENGTNLPSTEVYVQGRNLVGRDQAIPVTRGSYAYPLHTEEGYETARFYIRNDGYVPSYIDQSAALYYGPMSGGRNVGKIYTLFPFGHYNDRDLDYYQKDKKTGNNIGMFRYVYDAAGVNTQPAIMEAPSITEILSDEKTIQENAGNTEEVARIEGYLAMGEEYLKKHVLWYVVKEVGMQYAWHVDGTIVEDEVPAFTVSPDKVSRNVEIDIHQQEHKDWNEIKTSVHIRTDVESLEINLPISEENIVEQDDFAIRVYDFDYRDYEISHEITHNDKGITIRIYNIPGALIDELRSQIGDGLTVEIHSYCKKEDDLWEELKKSKVISLGKACTVNGQITSAFNDEKYPIYIE